jgi:hypothetical protein
MELRLSHNNFFCPATGKKIFYEEDCDETVESLKAYWCDLFFDEPFIKDNELKANWLAFVAKYQEENEGCDPNAVALEKFLREYDETNWVVFRFGGHSTAWHIIDMDTEDPDPEL